MAEKTGIQMIEEIQQKLVAMEKRAENVEFLLKQLLNKVNSEPKIEQRATIKQNETQIKKLPSKTNKIKIIGQIKNKEGKFVSGVNIKIFNSSNEIAKETRTNKAGEWMCLLEPGKYKVEYNLENIIKGKTSFTATQGQSLVRVPQNGV